MEQFSLFISDLFFTVTPVVRTILIFAFSYGEGLPVIGSILPGGTIALLVGSLSTQGFINPLFAVGVITIGSFLGDVTGFFAGKRLKHYSWLKRLVGDEKHQTSWDVFDRHLAIIVIFGKLIPVVRSTPSFFAGARNVKVQKYLFYSFLGSLLWALVGIYGGSILARVAGPAAIPIIIGVLIISGIAALVTQKHKAHKKKMRQGNPAQQ